VEIRHCAQLVEVSLEGNRLATPVLDLRGLGRLRSLQLFANPLEFLPELSPCTSLRHLSLANVRCFPHFREMARSPLLLAGPCRRGILLASSQGPGLRCGVASKRRLRHHLAVEDYPLLCAVRHSYVVPR
jgi:hypothetical protein